MLNGYKRAPGAVTAGGHDGRFQADLVYVGMKEPGCP
jgi:hypothetical protein